MPYREYIRGDEVTLGVAPTGYRYSTAVNDALPVSPDTVATHVYESMALGATVAHLHGRDDDGEPAPERLPEFGSAVRELCGDGVVLDYAVGPDCPPGQFLDAIDASPTPELATVRLGSTHHRETERVIRALAQRGVVPNLLVTGGSALHAVERLRESLPEQPVVTLLCGAPAGAAGTPLSLLALLDAVPDDAHCFVRATGPNQYPLTTLAFFLGAHPTVGMADNLFFAPDDPVERNAQLVRTVAQVAQRSLRSVADVDRTRRRLALSAPADERGNLEA